MLKNANDKSKKIIEGTSQAIIIPEKKTQIAKSVILKITLFFIFIATLKNHRSMSTITLFVCTHRRSSQNPSCGGKDSEKLLAKLQLEAKESEVNVEAICCFGHCTEGVVVKIAPNGGFYHHVTQSDIPKLLADATLLNVD